MDLFMCHLSNLQTLIALPFVYAIFCTHFNWILLILESVFRDINESRSFIVQLSKSTLFNKIKQLNSYN